MKIKYQIANHLDLVLQDSKLDVDDVTKETGISRRTILNILEGKGEPSEESLERLYSFMYKNGYRINECDEILFKSAKHNGLVLYHGSKFGLNDITIDGSRSMCDFGKGFYLGESYKSALSFVAEQPLSVVYAFATHLKQLNVINLDMSLEWLIAVCYFRGTLRQFEEHPKVKAVIAKIENADVIIAPIADNMMFYIMSLFSSGELTDVETIKSLAASDLGKQHVLKTKKAIDSIECIGINYLCKNEKYNAQAALQERSIKIRKMISNLKRNRNPEGQYIEEILA